MKAIIDYHPERKTRQTALVCDSALTRAKDPFFVPNDQRWYGMPLRGVRIDRLGKGIEERFANRYYSECLTAVHPYTDSTTELDVDRWGRDGSLVISETISADNLSAEEKMKIDHLVSEFSKNMTLKTGDLILTGSTEDCFVLEQRSYNIDIPPVDGYPGFRLKIR